MAKSAMADPVFRSLWLAQAGSGIGSWMQTVGTEVDEPQVNKRVDRGTLPRWVPILITRLAAWIVWPPATTVFVRTGSSGPRGQPNGHNGTNAIPWVRHSSTSGAERQGH